MRGMNPQGAEMQDIGTLERALASENPVEELRAIALAWSKEGLGKKAIYAIFLRLYKRLQDEERTKEEDILGDVMDMIMDAYPPRNLNLPG
jgi:hypothetical protein